MYLSIFHFRSHEGWVFSVLNRWLYKKFIYRKNLCCWTVICQNHLPVMSICAWGGEGGEVQIEQWNSQSNLYSCTIKIVDTEYELCLSDYYFIKIWKYYKFKLIFHLFKLCIKQTIYELWLNDEVDWASALHLPVSLLVNSLKDWSVILDCHTDWSTDWVELWTTFEATRPI